MDGTTRGMEANYREGGARGEMAREIPKETLETSAKLSSRLVTATIAALGDSVATAEPAALQTGQMCEEVGPDVKSAQKWNCAPRKMTASNRAKMRSRDPSRCMYLVRRSLGRFGCEVKHPVFRELEADK